MARKMDPEQSREDEDLVMRDNDHGIRRGERNARHATNDRDRDVAEVWQREQMRGRGDFADTDFRARGAPGDQDNTGRIDGEEAFFSGSVGDLDSLDGAGGESEDIDLDTLGSGREQFFRDEEDDSGPGQRR